MDRQTNLATIYARRFQQAGLARRRRVWQVLCDDFFNRWVDPNSSVLDLACGYGEFINAVRARRKLAIDLNADARQFLDQDVTFYQSSAADLAPIANRSIDLVFTSNFLEHLPSKQACTDLFVEVARVLRPGGRFIILGPNIRYAYREYWDFYDHCLPLSDRSLAEGLVACGFAIERIIPRFLPYTMNSNLPTGDWAIRLYLKLPLAWRIIGKQFLVVAINRG
jgi:SAM-dependent methyltransferase